MPLLNQYYDYTFDIGRALVRTRYKPVDRKFLDLSEADARRLIQEAFGYIAQTPTGRAIIEVCASRVILIWFKSNSAYDPNIEGGVVKWDPLNVMWVADMARSTGRRNRTKFSNDFSGDLVVRQRGEAWNLTRPDADFVIHGQSAPLVLLHELGHMQQHIRRPHYFAVRFKDQALKYKKHLILGRLTPGVPSDEEDEVNFHNVPDMDTPWEVDNISWIEIPFVQQLRLKGIMDGVRWAYGDAVSNQAVSDVTTVGIGDSLAIKVRISETWHHLNEGWSVASDGASAKSVSLRDLGSVQRRITDSLKSQRCASLPPSRAVLDGFFEGWLAARQ